MNVCTTCGERLDSGERISELEAERDETEAKHDALVEAARAYSKNVGHSRKCTFLMVVQQQVSGKPCICGHDALAKLIEPPVGESDE